MARVLLILASVVAALSFTGAAQAVGGNYVFEGGTPRQQAQIKAALDASSFDWSVVRVQVTIRVAPGSGTYALPGQIYIDADLLSAGRFSWAAVQHEYAHQVDFFLFNTEQRDRLNKTLGGRDWCYGVSGLAHGEYGCERFASTLTWSYWQSKDNSFRPEGRNDESAALAPAAFRMLLGQMLQERPQA